MRPCIYVTEGWGIHDDRWTSSLQDLGFTPRVIRLGVDVHDPTQLREHVEKFAVAGAPILAGPLNSVTHHLVGVDAHLVGLSWGFDLHNMKDRNWLSRLDHLIVDSEATKLVATNSGLKDRKTTLLPWGVDLDVFTPIGPKADLTQFGIPDGARTFLSLRAHEEPYRVGDILEAFAHISGDFPDVHLLIGNRGSLSPNLQDQAAERGIANRTHFIGRTSEADLPALFRASDLYLSASEVDGTSVTLLQAMACACPVMVSDIPGNQCWVVPRQTGYLFQAADRTALGQGLAQWLTTDRRVIRAQTEKALGLTRSNADWKLNQVRLRKALLP